MKNFLEKYKIYLAISSYLIFSFILFHWGIFPYLKKMQQKSDDIQAKLIDNEMSESRLKKIPDMEDAYNEYEKNKVAFDVMLDSNNEVSFIKKIEDIASKTGNEIALRVIDVEMNKNEKRAIARGQEEKPIDDSLNHKDFLKMEITLKGNYVGLVNFVNKLENLSSYVNVLSIDSKKETKSEENSGRYSTVGSLFGSLKSEESQSSREGEKGEHIMSVLNIAVYIKK